MKQITRSFARHYGWLVLALVPLMYLLTVARGLVLGDPTEFTFVANILGIAHPPGYAFITLVGKLFQSLNPVGTYPWRMHLLSVTGATAAAWLVYGTVRTVGRTTVRLSEAQISISALFAALTTATAVNYWQHAIHTNPHILTAGFLSANLFWLTRWWAAGIEGERGDKWLFAFCLTAGLGITHHPLTVFGFPAYALFIIYVRPGIWREWRTLLRMFAFAVLGLSVWLYFPIRSAMGPAFGPHTMNTLDGFLNHVLARGITESLPFYSLADQPGRLLVFWTLLRLQYALPIIFLAFLGPTLLATGRPTIDRGTIRPLLILYGLAFLTYYAFVLSLRQQDIMAYLLGIFLLVGLFSGIGLLGLLDLLQNRIRPGPRLVAFLLVPLILWGPLLQVVKNLPRISLASYTAGDAYADQVFSWFAGRGEGATLLNDWEHQTPLWYYEFVEGRIPDPADVRPRLVATDRPWLQSVFDFLPGGPVFLSGYRREIVDAGFRLRPRGSFYQVVEPGDETLPPELTPIQVSAGEIEIVGYQLPKNEVTAGDYVPLTLAMRASTTLTDYYVPVVNTGELDFTFTTDSHLLTTLWQPNEVIVERFDFALPHDSRGGELPITLSLKNLSQDRLIDLETPLGQLRVDPKSFPIRTEHLLANFRQRVGLVSATARTGLTSRRTAPWDTPLTARPGETIRLTLRWESLALAEESYTVFLHLIDLANRPMVTLDYTPLGGSTPTYLWIPKWLPGQRMLDPYRLVIPPELPPGNYLVEVGLYEMTSQRRLHMADKAGNLVGDRFILGGVTVTAR